MSDFMIMVFDWFMLKMCNPMKGFDWLIDDTWVMMLLMWFALVLVHFLVLDNMFYLCLLEFSPPFISFCWDGNVEIIEVLLVVILLVLGWNNGYHIILVTLKISMVYNCGKKNSNLYSSFTILVADLCIVK